MSRIHYTHVSLEELVAKANLICLAKKDVPFIRRKKMSITPLFYKILGKSLPPFIWIKYGFIVSEILASDRIAIARNQKIEVNVADHETKFRIHKAYHLKGVRKSPRYNIYETNASLNDGNDLILILNVLKFDIVEFAAENSYESVATKETIKTLIKNIGRK